MTSAWETARTLPVDLGGDDAPASSRAGDLIAGRYRLTTPLGRGGHGEVWAADDLVVGEPVAIKRMLPLTGVEAARVRREIAALRILRLPGVVRLLDEGTEGGRPFLVMERIDGVPFPGVAPGEGGRVAWTALADRVVALLETLARVHAAGVIHRDLKPANVLVGADGRPVVLDFGLSSGPALGGGLTGSGQILGTPAYLAPEQILGHPIDARTDLFAFGVMLYEALAGRRPHEGGEGPALLRARLLERALPLSDLAPEVPPAVADLVERLLARAPDDRPASAANALALLAGDRAPPTFLRRLGGDAPVRAVIEAACAGRSIDVVGAPGSGRTRCLDDAAERLASEGRELVRLRPSRLPFAALHPLVGALESASARALPEVITGVEAQLRAALGRGVIVIADDAQRLDRWSAAALDRCRDAGVVIRAWPHTESEESEEGVALLAPLDEAALRSLFAGPDRLFHLREDGARTLWERSEGVPSRIVDEVNAWVRAGLARWDASVLVVHRDALDRLAAGLQVAPPLPRAAQTAFDEAPHLEDLLAWLSIAGPRVRVAALAAAREQPLWRVEADLEDLALAGMVRRLPGGRVEARRQADCALDAARLRDAHRAIASAQDPGEEGRLFHLLAADENEALVREAIELGRRRAREGQLGQAGAALAEGLLAARRGGGAAPVEILCEWAKLALAEGTPPALDRALYELCRAADRPAALLPIEALLRASLVMAGGSGERAFTMADAIPRFADVELERRRQRLRVMAARRGASASAEAALVELRAWATASDAPEARVSLAEGLGFLRYAEGRFEDAARLQGEAARDEPFLVARVAATINAASALLEAFRVVEADELAASAQALAERCRHPYYEGRAAWLRRAIAYRRGSEDAADLELVAATERVGVLSLEAMVCLTEAAFAYREGAQGAARSLADRAAQATRRLGRRSDELLGRCLAIAAGAPAGDEEIAALVDRACACPVAGLGLQALGLLAEARPDAPRGASAVIDQLSAAIPREHWGVRMDVLSVIEARSSAGELKPPSP